MFLRALVLVAGAAAILIGGILIVLIMTAPPQPAQTPGKPQQEVLVAAKPLVAGTLLRADDLRWQETPAAEVPAAGYLRGRTEALSLSGAALRRTFALGEPLIADQVVKSSEPGFLAVALGSGMRAVTIAVDAAEANAGLVVPGDRIDVVLTQIFNDAGVALSRRSASETVLTDLRVIATDQAIISVAVKPEESGLLHTPDAKTPKTVTLEVTVAQAQTLMLASRLGSLQLTLRGAGDAVRSAAETGPLPQPTWAYEVSPALRALDLAASVAKPRATHTAAPTGPASVAIEIIHGSKVEERCFDATGRALSNCGTAGAAPEPPRETPAPRRDGAAPSS